MNLGTIEITPEEATERLAEIERVLVAERTAEDVALAQAYRAAKRGHGVISLRRAFEIAGQFPNGLPRLAIVSADAKRCRVDARTTSRDTTVLYRFSDADYFATDRAPLVGANHVHVRVDDVWQIVSTGVRRNRSWNDGSTDSGSTIVPSIPPQLRPKPNKLRHCHILWEVEKWDPTPPVDPALVKHIRGDLWAVLATWDLTELERLVLTQRA